MCFENINGEWSWVDSEVVDYTNWGNGYPDGPNGQKAYINEFAIDGYWDDTQENNSFKYVLELEPTTS